MALVRHSEFSRGLTVIFDRRLNFERNAGTAMLRIDRATNRLVRLPRSTLADSAHWERDLQAMICADPSSFCQEIGEGLWFVGQEVRPSDTVSDRIDILAIDEDGYSVVIELKRGSNKLQLLQAISYAGMVARWSADRFVETLATNFRQSADDARAAIEDHTGSDITSINQAQRILLIAEDFDPALLIATEWLHEHYDVDIRCYRLHLSQENETNYLTCTCIYPPIEIASLSRASSSRQAQTTTRWTDWNTALEAVENTAVKDFYRAQLANHQEARLPYRELIYRIDGRRRFWLSCRRRYVYVWQRGRFENDETYWRDILSEPNHVQQVNENRELRFHLSSAADFTSFDRAISEDMNGKEFTDAPEVQGIGIDDQTPPSDGDNPAPGS